MDLFCRTFFLIFSQHPDGEEGRVLPIRDQQRISFLSVSSAGARPPFSRPVLRQILAREMHHSAI